MATNRSQKFLAECDECDTVIPVVVRETGEIALVGTGGVCPCGYHTFTIRGQTVSPPHQRNADGEE